MQGGGTAVVILLLPELPKAWGNTTTGTNLDTDASPVL